MNLEEKEDMSRYILDVNEQFGTTIALIEHDMGVVMDLVICLVVAPVPGLGILLTSVCAGVCYALGITAMITCNILFAASAVKCWVAYRACVAKCGLVIADQQNDKSQEHITGAGRYYAVNSDRHSQANRRGDG